MAHEQRLFTLNLDALSDVQKVTRSQAILGSILEAFYSSHENTQAPKIHNYEHLIQQVGEMLYRDAHDARPVQFLYIYLVQVGSEKMEQLLQDLGHHLVDNYGMQFGYVEMMLNMLVKRLAAIGRMRALQRGDHLKYIRQGGNIGAERMMRGDW